MQQSFFMLARG